MVEVEQKKFGCSKAGGDHTAFENLVGAINHDSFRDLPDDRVHGGCGRPDAGTFIRAFSSSRPIAAKRNSRPGSAGGDECVPELAPEGSPARRSASAMGQGNLDG